MLIIYSSIFVFLLSLRFIIGIDIILAATTTGCSATSPTVNIVPNQQYGLPEDTLVYTISIKNNDNPSLCDTPILYKIEIEQCPFGWQCNLNKNFVYVNVGGTDSSTQVSVKSNSSYIPKSYLFQINVSNKTGTNFNFAISNGYYIVSRIFLNYTTDYSGIVENIGLYGDENYLNAILNASYEGNLNKPFIVSCVHNNKNCPILTGYSPIVCTINNPSYNCNVNTINCTFYNPNNNQPLTSFIRSFSPINFSVVTNGEIHLDVGEKKDISLTLISYSLLETNYTINITTIVPNYVLLSNNYFNTTSLRYGNSFSSSYNTFLLQSFSDNYCLNCINVVATSNIGKCSIFVPVSLRTLQISLNDYDIIGLIKILFYSLLIFSLIVFKVPDTFKTTIKQSKNKRVAKTLFRDL